MEEKEVILTKEGYDKLEEELNFLKTEKRAEIADRIKVALGFGDLSENSEYDEAKNAQAENEVRIAELENKLRHAKIIDEKEIDKMYILGSDGKPQMDLVGGERIISRSETRSLIIKAKRANKSKSDKDYKKLGKYIFKVLEKQDNRKPEYVNLPK